MAFCTMHCRLQRLYHLKPISMNTPKAIRLSSPEHLSVIHKASLITDSKFNGMQAAVLQTDISFNITGWNAAAEALHGRPGGMGRNLFELVEIIFVDGNLEQLREQLLKNGSWSGEVFFKRFDGQHIHFQ